MPEMSKPGLGIELQVKQSGPKVHSYWSRYLYYFQEALLKNIHYSDVRPFNMKMSMVLKYQWLHAAL
jgi:hypothetical protein